MSPSSRVVPILLVLFTLVGCDHATKYTAREALMNGPARAVLGSVLQLHYVENRDIAFNLLRWVPEHTRKPLLTALGAVAILALLVVLVRGRVSGIRGAALLAILAGALGNYLDRIFRGYVVDFIQVPHWPVFNVADILVTLGATLLFWSTFRPAPRPTDLAH